jgi:hypothetical protein
LLGAQITPLSTLQNHAHRRLGAWPNLFDGQEESLPAEISRPLVGERGSPQFPGYG